MLGWQAAEAGAIIFYAQRETVLLCLSAEANLAVRKAAGILHRIVEHVGDQFAVERPFIKCLTVDTQENAGCRKVLSLFEADFVAKIGNIGRNHRQTGIVAQQAIGGQGA